MTDDAPPPDTQPISLVLDTNVFLDVHSCHDLLNDFDRLTAQLGSSDAALAHPDIQFRIIRARESMRLAIWLNKMGTTTWTPRTEAVTMLMRRAPPQETGGRTMTSDFTTTFVNYVKDYVLPDWSPLFPGEEDGVTGDAADLALLDYAEVNALPIVTNEGVFPGEIRESKKNNMRRRGSVRGVRVYAPRQLYAGRMDVDAESDAFLERFRARARQYIEDRGIDDQIRDVIVWVHGYYLMTLRGVVEGRDTPIC